MKNIYLFFLFCFCAPTLFAQNKLNGSYFNSADFEIAIVDTTFYFVIDQGMHAIFANDTLAKCSIKKVSDNFIELNSERPIDIVRKSMRIVQEYDSTIVDGKQVIFDFPCQREVEVEVITDNFEFLKFDYSPGRQSLMLPAQTKSFGYVISLKELPLPLFNGVFCGLVKYEPFQDIIFENGKNVIHVSLPAVNDTFFERFLLQGEYARVCGDSIFWKGDVYVKDK